MAAYLEDPRRQLPGYLLADRQMLEAWLEFQRATLMMKCEGLDDESRKRRPVPTSKLSLHGLLRHTAEVERNWFQRVLLSNEAATFIWSTPGVPDSELEPLDDADWDADLATWQASASSSTAASASDRRPRHTLFRLF